MMSSEPKRRIGFLVAVDEDVARDLVAHAHRKKKGPEVALEEIIARWFARRRLRKLLHLKPRRPAKAK